MAKKNVQKTAPASTSDTANADQLSSPVGQATVSRFQKFEMARVHRSKLHPAEYNPRTIDKHAKKKLRESLKTHGLAEPIIINRQTGGTLVGGHQRLEQLDELEGSLDYYLDVAVVDVPLAQEQALNITLNNSLLAGTYDFDLLEQIIGQPDFDVRATGFDRASLGTILDEGILDGLFGAGAAAQAVVEQPVIAQLEEIKESGREADAAARTEQAAQEQREAAVEKMRQGRKAYIAKSQDGNASEFFVVLVADSEAEADTFLLALEQPVDQRYIDLRIVAEKLGIELKTA
jgi:ParB-like chromosome segregation protein Spo0J